VVKLPQQHCVRVNIPRFLEVTNEFESFRCHASDGPDNPWWRTSVPVQVPRRQFRTLSNIEVVKLGSQVLCDQEGTAGHVGMHDAVFVEGTKAPRCTQG